jgi:hypothetical protein
MYFFCKGEMMNIEKETSEYQRIVATVVGDLSEAELKFYLCVINPQRKRIYPLWVKTNSAHRYHFLA